jgi:hypothetical protein
MIKCIKQIQNNLEAIDHQSHGFVYVEFIIFQKGKYFGVEKWNMQTPCIGQFQYLPLMHTNYQSCLDKGHHGG